MDTYITVFCSANATRIPQSLSKEVKHFAHLLVENNYHLIWGGSDEKLMHLMATEVKKHGGKIQGVSLKILKHLAFKGADKMFFAYDHQHRKQLMLKQGKAIVALPGGIGTLDEIITALELKKHGLYTKPIILLNTNNFFKELIAYVQKLKRLGFIKNPLKDLFFVAKTSEEVIRYLKKSL